MTLLWVGEELDQIPRSLQRMETQSSFTWRLNTKVTIDNCLSHGHRQQLMMYTHVQIQRWRYQQIYFVISQTIDGAAIMKLPF